MDDIITTEITSNGYIDSEQLRWLKKELDKSNNETVLIFMHVPVVEPFASPNHKLRNASEVMSLIESYKKSYRGFSRTLSCGQSCATRQCVICEFSSTCFLS